LSRIFSGLILRNEPQALIECAAALMHSERISDPIDALKRAAKRLGYSPNRWPKPELVRLALQARLALFDPDCAPRLLRMRQAAAEAMVFFPAFIPRLVGGVFDGTALAGSAIEIECLCEHPDQLRMRLDELKIPAQQRQKLSARSDRTWFEFKAGDFDYIFHVITQHEHGAELGADLGKLKRILIE
jgi:hypothetical protein